MLQFKKYFIIYEYFLHCITDHAASLARFPGGNSTCHKTSCTLQGLRGQPGKAKPRHEHVPRVISYTFLTFPFSSVSEGYISMQIISCKAQERAVWPSAVAVSVQKRASE